MYQIEKVLNNNSVLVGGEDGTSMIFMRKGIGFGMHANDLITMEDTMDIYHLAPANERGSTLDMVDEVDPIYIEIAAKIIDLANVAFGDVDTNILLPLADHIAFSIERLKQEMDVSNPFTNEIRLLYQKEFNVALEGKKIIEQELGYIINDDEVGYITLHIHASLSEDKLSQSIQAAMIIKESIEQIEKDFQILIQSDSMSYVRLMNHMKFLLLRLRSGEDLKVDVSGFVKDTFPYAYQTAEHICMRLSKVYEKTIDDVEVGYLALHIERIRTSELAK